MTKSIYENTNFAMVQVVFTTEYHVPHELSGERVVALVGGNNALGEWDPNEAPRGIEYPPRSGKWYITTWLPALQGVDCKLALVSPGPGYVLWETGPNKHLPGLTLDGSVHLAWGADQPEFRKEKLPDGIAFCTIITRHLLPNDLELKMVGSFHTIGDWQIMRAPKTRLVPGTSDWRYTCAVLPKTGDIEWKWGVCKVDGSDVFMERWTNRFMLLNSRRTSNYLINAPWETYALVMEILLPTKSAGDESLRPSLDISPGSSGHGSSLQSPESTEGFPDYRRNHGDYPGGRGNPGENPSGKGNLGGAHFYRGNAKECFAINSSGKDGEDNQHSKPTDPVEHFEPNSKESENGIKEDNLNVTRTTLPSQNNTPSESSMKLTKPIELTPQIIQLLKTLLKEDEEEEKKRQEELELLGGNRSPRRQASRVSPLPPIEELSPEKEEVRIIKQVVVQPQQKVIDLNVNDIELECLEQEVSPIKQSVTQNALDLSDYKTEMFPNQPEADHVINDLERDFDLGIEGHPEVEKEEGESCYGSMATAGSSHESSGETGDSDDESESEVTETSPGSPSDVINPGFRKKIYRNTKIAKSCQEVSHWLLNNTHEPMRKSYSLDENLYPEDVMEQQAENTFSYYDWSDFKNPGVKKSNFVKSVQLPSYEITPNEEKTIFSAHAHSVPSACVSVMSEIFRNVMKERC